MYENNLNFQWFYSRKACHSCNSNKLLLATCNDAIYKASTSSHRGWRENEYGECAQTLKCLDPHPIAHILMAKLQHTVLIHWRIIPSILVGSRKQNMQMHIYESGRFGGGKTKYLFYCFYSHLCFLTIGLYLLHGPNLAWH